MSRHDYYSSGTMGLFRNPLRKPASVGEGAVAYCECGHEQFPGRRFSATDLLLTCATRLPWGSSVQLLSLGCRRCQAPNSLDLANCRQRLDCKGPQFGFCVKRTSGGASQQSTSGRSPAPGPPYLASRRWLCLVSMLGTTCNSWMPQSSRAVAFPYHPQGSQFWCTWQASR